jgi:hypothetical protein
MISLMSGNGTAVTVTSNSGFYSHVLKVRVFVGEGHEARAKAWAATQSGWDRMVTTNPCEVDEVA